MHGDVTISAKKLRTRKKFQKIIKIVLIILVITVIIIYVVFSVIYNGYNFTITLDSNLYYDNHLIIYETESYKVYRRQLRPESLEYFDNMSYKWLPNDINDYEGSHNGPNYFAYSFYIENMGDEIEDYYMEVIIDDVVKNVDDAIRYRIYFDDEETTYAKISPDTNNAEPGTTPFESDELITKQHVEKFGPGDKHKYTIVIWLEGSDPECTNNIIGGEFRAHMEFKSEFTN